METPDDRKEAERQSYGCPECGGGGITSRYMEQTRRDGEVFVASVGCICHRCVAGRWVARASEGKESRLLDLADQRYAVLRLEIYKFPPPWNDMQDDPDWSDPRPAGSTYWRAIRGGLREVGKEARA